LFSSASDFRRNLLAFAGVLATNFFWATNALLSTEATKTIEPLHLSFWRWSFALVFLLPFGYKAFGRVAYIRSNLLWLGLLSLLGVTLFNLLLYTASQGTTAINITLINTLAPVAILLAGWLLVGKSPTKRQQLGMLIGFVGALIILTGGDVNQLLGLSFNPGDSIMAGAVIDWGLYSVLLLRLSGRTTQIELLTLLIALGVLWLVLFELIAYGGLPFALLLDAHNLLLFAYLAIFPSILAYLFWNNGMQQLGPILTGLSIYAQPAFGALLSWLLLGQLLQTHHLTAAVCIGLALLLCIIKRRQPG